MRKKKTIKVNIPAGIDNGQIISLRMLLVVGLLQRCAEFFQGLFLFPVQVSRRLNVNGNELVSPAPAIQHEVTDYGCSGHDSCDYADFAAPAARDVAQGRQDRGIVMESPSRRPAPPG